MADAYLGLDHAPELVVFRTRLGLTVIDLVGGVGHPDAARALTRVVNEALATGDGYAARDVLAHDGCRATLTDSAERALTSAVRSSGLGQGTIPEPLLADLISTAEIAEKATAQCLKAATRTRPRDTPTGSATISTAST